jgi:tubulin polyglutamylase TTLL5
MMIQEREDEDSLAYNGTPAVKTDTGLKFLIFRPVLLAERPFTHPNTGYMFKFLGNEVKLIRWVFEDNGFREGKANWLVGWSNTAMRSQVYQNLTPRQKVNHFPRSHEITKKDNLFKNISKMQSLHGKRHYNFIPETFVLPNESILLSERMDKDPEALWIVKPAGSSQGKGIFLTNRFAEIPMGQAMVASRYISNPLLINGLKFDLRIYVAVTSMDPLRIYIYREGMARFATEPYDLSNFRNRFVHLTNYSLNKYSPNFIDMHEDGKGFKWTLTALKDFLLSQGVNFSVIWDQIKDIAVKTIISIETVINSAMNMFVPSRKNCFELLGFDILIDDNLRPWLLEVNLSPSMNTETSIDLRIKSVLIADLFNLTGIRRLERPKRRNSQVARPAWSSGNGASGLSKKELQVLKETETEIKRKGNFECCFPSQESLLYKQFFDVERPLNNLLMAHYAAAKKDIYKHSLQEYESKLGSLRKDLSARSAATPLKALESSRSKLPTRMNMN